MRYIFIGMKHCGKTTHGRIFAESRKLPFYDTDDLLESLHRKKTGKTENCRTIFNAYGAEYFNELESELIENIYQGAYSSSVIAMGGRMPINDKLQDKLKKLGFYVYVKAPTEAIFKRIKRKGLPAFIDQDRPFDSVCEMIQQREPYYERLANITIEVNDLPVKIIAGQIKLKIRESENGR